ncbi:carboxy terminal-processing peptidase, partial [Saprospiraceae bacterium]|nr:carboxy terminal-processing peptidase [Saprospiraceae bacterium]
LTIRKKSGKTLVITIERDEVIVDESFARSVVVDFKDVKNIGFISLPVFYSTFDGKNSCAEDVKKEVEKLNAQNVNGIILDLRWNGGGSLQDVIDMSGLFIEEGPIVQVKSGDGKASVYKDRDSSVSYDGPMIVMTNMVSASASEILAGALQDYGRAVIVGSNSTFGKGTVQGFYDLDRVYNGSSDLKPLGQVKMTTQKFYRINGGSNQLTGIIPDIILPDNFSYVNVGEKEYDNALEWSKIDPVKYQQNVYQLPDLSILKQNSSERVAASNIFNLIDDNAQYIKEVENDSDVPLSLKGYKAYLAEREARAEKYDNIMKNPIDGLSISNLAIDLDYIQADSSRIARNEDWLKGLHKDVYLQETVLIMKDMINGEQ